MVKKRGQISIEGIMLIAFVVLFIIFLMFNYSDLTYRFGRNSIEAEASKLENQLNRIADSDPGTRFKMELDFGSDITRAEYQNGRLIIYSTNRNGEEESVAIPIKKVFIGQLTEKGTLFIENIEDDHGGYICAYTDPASRDTCCIDFACTCSDMSCNLNLRNCMFGEHTDLDCDFLPDWYDGDDDNDGVPDAHDGDSTDPTVGNPGWEDDDTDGDGIPDWYDSDDNNDNTPDATPDGDADNDGIPTAFDSDDGDANEGQEVNNPIGVEDWLQFDTDKDGVPDWLDPDDDNDGVPDTFDSHPQDDSVGSEDGDSNSIPDWMEIDTDGDGLADIYDIDDDGDNIPDAHDPNPTGPSTTPADTDTDNIPDWIEEQHSDNDGDNRPDWYDIDDDNDGVIDEFDPSPKSDKYGPIDLDQDGIPDWLQPQDPGEGFDWFDADGDDLPDWWDDDDDNDGVRDVDDINPVDADVGGEDNNNNNLPDFQENDNDNDGLPDFLDDDDDNDNILDKNDAHPFNPDIGDEDPGDGNGGTTPDGTPDIEQFDNDGDGSPDIEDDDDDGDGEPDEGDPNPEDDDVDPPDDLPNKQNVIQICSCGTLSQPNTIYEVCQNLVTTGTCFTVTAENITIDGNDFNITGDDDASDYGVYAEGQLGLFVKDTTYHDFGRGVYLLATNKSYVYKTHFNSTRFGVYLYHTTLNLILNNTMGANEDTGGFIWLTNDSTISQNRILDPLNHGIQFTDVGNLSVYRNNLSNGTYGLYLQSLVMGSRFRNNTALYFSSGIEASTSDSNNITNFTTQHGDSAGISFSNSYYNYIRDVVSYNHTYGLYLTGTANGFNVSRFNSTNDTTGFYITGAGVYDNRFYDNRIDSITDVSTPSAGVNFWNVTFNATRKNVLGNYGYGGNYYGDWDGTGFSESCADTNYNGICDSSNTHDASNIDSLPLSNVNATQITTCVELQNLTTVLTAAYALIVDINCSDTVNWHAGAGFDPIGGTAGSFRGTFLGLNHTISELFIYRPSTNNISLFGFAEGAIITDLGVVDANITGRNSVGGLIGNADNHSGTQPQGYVLRSFTSGSVSGSNSVGGLVGYVDGFNITNVYSTASVNGSQIVGGLVGQPTSHHTTSVNNAYATGVVTATASIVGGLFGNSALYVGTTTNAFSTGNVTSNIPGNGSMIGVRAGSSTALYWHNHSGNPDHCNTDGTSAQNTGCTDETTQSYFFDVSNEPMASWDFTNAWSNMLDGQSYPPLKWQEECPADMDGAGTQANPCLVTTCAQLQAISEWLNANYSLANDVDCSATPTWNSGAGFDPIGNCTAGCVGGAAENPFVGIFNGSGYTISHLYINRPSEAHVALFAGSYASADVYGTFYDILIDNATVVGNNYTGTLIGKGYKSIINGVKINGTVNGTGNVYVGGIDGEGSFASVDDVYFVGSLNNTGTNTGGLLGLGEQSNVSNSHVNATIVGATLIGGIMSGGNLPNVTNSYVYVNITGTSYIGGIFNSADGPSIKDSFAVVNITAAGGNTIGGMIGSCYGSPNTFENNYVIGTITAGQTIGGLIGSGEDLTINNSNATVNLTLTSTSGGGLVGVTVGGLTVDDSRAYIIIDSQEHSVGGLIGYSSNPSTILNSYAIGTISAGNGDAGGLLGYAPDSLINDSHADVNVSSTTEEEVGGLVGYLGAGQIHRSNASGNVDGNSWYVGGLVGGVGGAVINQSYATGDVVGTNNVGGFIGNADGAIIDQSFATGDVEGDQYVGGFIGNADVGTTGTNITNSYATGNVTGSTQYAGGFIGAGSSIQVNNSYATGNVYDSGTYTGGFIGFMTGGLINRSYSTGNVTASGTPGGFAGYLHGSVNPVTIDTIHWLNRSGDPVNCVGGGQPVYTVDCTTQTEFKYFLDVSNSPMTLWDLSSTWDTIHDEVNHPVHRWEARTQAEVISCANLTLSDTPYVLMRDLVTDGDCFVIEWVNDVIIDGQGYAINGTDGGSNDDGVVVLNSQGHTIENLSIDEFWIGVNLTSTAEFVTVANTTITGDDGTDVYRGIMLDGANNTTIHNNTMRDVGTGLSYLEGASDNNITNNTLEDNKWYGIYHGSGASPSNNNFENNTACNNAIVDIFCSTAQTDGGGNIFDTDTSCSGWLTAAGSCP